MDKDIDVADITRLLEAATDGSTEALENVFEVAYPRLREIAHARRRGWRGSDTLKTTGLVHEAYLELASAGAGSYESRGQFFATTARAMRQVLITYAQKQSTEKRAGGRRDLTLYESDAVTYEALDELLSLDDALKNLEAVDACQAGVVECLFFAGLTVAETAEAVRISPATVKRDWSAARAWLHHHMHGDQAPAD
jgi:RNA polymerase sigma factor (TIGR02999 family)